MSDLLVSRRRLLRAGALGAGALALPAWARGADLHGGFIRPGFDEVSGRDISLTIGEGPRVVQGRRGHAVAVNGSVPGPLVRLREGQPVRLAVTNALEEDSSIHWHGLLLPFQFDGVPGVSFPGIKPGETFVSEEHTSELQSLMRISYAVFCLKKKYNNSMKIHNNNPHT